MPGGGKVQAVPKQKALGLLADLEHCFVDVGHSCALQSARGKRDVIDHLGHCNFRRDLTI